MFTKSPHSFPSSATPSSSPSSPSISSPVKMSTSPQTTPFMFGRIGHAERLHFINRQTAKATLKGLCLAPGELFNIKCAPSTEAWVKTFAAKNIMIDTSAAQNHFGKPAKEHALSIIKKPAVYTQWLAQHSEDIIDEDLQELCSLYLLLKKRFINEKAILANGSEQVLEMIRQLGIDLVLTTAYSHDETILAKTVLEEKCQLNFKHVINGEGIVHPYPGPEIFHRAANVLNILAPQLAIIGHTPFELTAGINANAWTIAVPYGNFLKLPPARKLSEEDLAFRNCMTKQHLKELGVHYVVDWEEIPEVLADINTRLANGETPANERNDKSPNINACKP